MYVPVIQSAHAHAPRAFPAVGALGLFWFVGILVAVLW